MKLSALFIFSAGILTGPLNPSAFALDIDTGTRISSTVAAPTLEAFKNQFGQLSESEQSEVVHIFTTEMRGWEASARIPTKINIVGAPDEQKKSTYGLLTWLREEKASDELSHLRFVGLTQKPFELKLRFEKGPCLKEPGGAFNVVARWWGKLKAVWPTVARRPAGVDLDGPLPEGQCRRQLTVALAADIPSREGLWEKPFLNTDTVAFSKDLDGNQGLAFRRKVWEEVEILLASEKQDTSTLADRLRVIEVVGPMNEQAFKERREQALVLRKGQASARP